MEQALQNLTYGKAILIGLALVAAYYFFFYDNGAYYQAQIQKARANITKDNNEIKTIDKAIKDAELYEKTMATVGQEMDRVDKAVPTKFSSLDLMRIVSEQAKQIGVEINSVSPDQAFRSSSNNKDVFFEPVSISVSLTGTYNQIMQFMSSLTRLDKIVTVQMLSMGVRSSYNNKSTTPMIHFKADLAAYRLLTPEEMAKAKGVRR